MGKFTKLSAKGNLRWESSRMILPEHRHAMQAARRDLRRQTKPSFDEQFQEELEQNLQAALHERSP